MDKTTGYQKGYQVAIKTDTQIKKIIKAHDSGNAAHQIEGFAGLDLYIRENKTTTFRHRYTSPNTGKRPYYTLGTYPYMTLEQARERHSENMRLLKNGIDPKLHDEKLKDRSSSMPTFAIMADEWLQAQVSSNHFEKRTIDQKSKHINYANEHIGRMSIDKITTPDVLRAIKDIEQTMIPTAKRVRGVCQKVFALAIGRGYIDNNPAIAVADLMLPKNKTEHHSAIINPADFGQLLNDIDNVIGFYGHTKNIIKLQSLLFQRNQDMCSMRWDAIDFDAKTWAFNPSKTGNRADMVSNLVVPLPTQAIEILKQMHADTGKTDYVFYNVKRRSKHEHPQQLNKYLWRLGYKDIHTPHGFRASARTMMVEQLGIPEQLIELQLGHNVRDANGRAYNRVTLIKERANMMQVYADYLDELKGN
ncbi:tyrosine-type recombinase/integrase [Psychrobacter namhaensis]|uniref:tyrosine-type recombinase/integrase n=1 Tax=Psychrobacter namhaensis TaxID=292734 RepID=UPI001D0F909B|nr:site-specific integrase [Psychrobacter namhaensis]